MIRAARTLAWVLALAIAPALLAPAQNPRETERRLERVRGELGSIARERRKLEGERGDASRKLREADEQVGRSSRTLADTEAALRREEAALAGLQQRRAELQQRQQRDRAELAALLRASYTVGGDAPLKVLLAQESVAGARRALTYHGYLHRDRASRIAALSGQLDELQSLEAQIVQRREQLDAARRAQQAQVADLRLDRRTRADLVADLERRYQDRSAREKALGQDARALEQLLSSLRAAAARAEAQRQAAARRAAQAQAGRDKAPATRAPARPAVASAPAPRVGGLGWPLSGNLLTRYGGRLPDGRTSPGVLIGAPVGSTVTAVADGTVVFSEWMTGYGLILILDHGNGYMSLYAHNDSLLRDTGDRVARGDAIARVGSSGAQGTPALYFELRRDGRPVDPASWLQRR
ncbi:murein hydrolase activator EnvC family protein [Pseudoxanthomonas mexicana]|uniref:murein hydrolase activator EnvC family protein n=1 Tax=Pseudoxanthomonas mexicana TaxID=128785 RepID=UPI00398A95A5